MMNLLAAQTMIPNDFELAIPGNIGFFKVLLVVSFILHIFFVNLTVAGSVLAVFNEWRGWIKNNPRWDRLAEKLAVQVSIHKSLAVVLGVAPLLIISVIYTRFYYPSTILIGKAWLMLIAIIIVAFLMLYVYKFTWERWQNKKGLHLFFGLGGALLLLYVPLVFLTSVASMLQPELWKEGLSIFTAFFHYPTIWERYLHFLFATMAIMGIYLIVLGNRQKRENPEDGELFVSFGKNVALLFTFLQLAAGPILLFSLKGDVMQLFLGGSALQTGLLVVGIILALLLIFSLYQYKRSDSRIWLRSALVLIVLVVSTMGWLRHEVRDSYLAPYENQAVHDEQVTEQALEK
ncbi:MAG: cytochrome c class I [Bacillaceae bacterium]|nr:cytochrome c class I [Bacillaceae bacterium]